MLRFFVSVQWSVELHIAEFIDLYGYNLSLVAAGRRWAGEECSPLHTVRYCTHPALQ